MRKKSIAFIMPNAPLETKDMPKYIVSVREIESETELNFILRSESKRAE